MKKSKISKTVLMSAAALSSGLLLPAVLAAANESMPTDVYGQNDRYVDFEQYREAVNELRARVATDAEFRARYLANPREVLLESGLPVDLQLELMRADRLAFGPAFGALDCICTQTCVVTNKGK